MAIVFRAKVLVEVNNQQMLAVESLVAPISPTCQVDFQWKAKTLSKLMYQTS